MRIKYNPATIVFFTTIVICIFVFCSNAESAEKSGKTLLTYNQDILSALNSEIIKKSGTKRSVAVLKGLRWCVIFCDIDENFNFTFSNYITMLDEISVHSSDPSLKRIVHDLLLKEFHRASSRLKLLFPADIAGYEDFVSILPIVYHHRIPLKPLKKFFDSYFTGVVCPDRLAEFRSAAEKRDYDSLTDLVVGAAFTDMAYRWNAGRDFRLPVNIYQTVMKECIDIPFLYKFKDKYYHEQNYYATHVLLALNHYGQRNYKPSVTGDKIFFYLTGQYLTVRHQVDDIDLICEYLYCLRLYGIKNTNFIKEGEQYIISVQKNDGSWGKEDSPDDDPYDKLHPTWTAITLLVQPEM